MLNKICLNGKVSEYEVNTCTIKDLNVSQLLAYLLCRLKEKKNNKFKI